MNKLTTGRLGVALAVTITAWVFASAFFSEAQSVNIAFGVITLLEVIALIITLMRTKSGAYGVHSGITTLLIFLIVGGLNFISHRYYKRFDCTRNKLHSFSEQTIKVVKEIKEPIKATLFARPDQKESFKTLLEHYHNINSKFDFEIINPDRNPVLVKQQNIRKYNTLILSTEPKKELRIDDITEEKITNALIKLLKPNSSTICFLEGHGEKKISLKEADGLSEINQALESEAYITKTVNLMTSAEISKDCNALVIWGPAKSYLDHEVKLISDFLNQGGRALVALDLNLKGSETNPELVSLLNQWYVTPEQKLVVDPISRLLNLDASVAMIADLNSTHPITKSSPDINCAFPLSRPLKVHSNVPSELSVTVIGSSTPKSWAVADLQQLQKGQIKYNPQKDQAGPIAEIVAISGKKKETKAEKETRLVVFGASTFATNQMVKLVGNLDIFLNSASWILEDESFITIRSKDPDSGRLDISNRTASLIFVFTSFFAPLLVLAIGVGVWIARRRK